VLAGQGQESVNGPCPVRVKLKVLFMLYMPVLMTQPYPTVVDLICRHHLEEPIEFVGPWWTYEIKANGEIAATIGQLKVPGIARTDPNKRV